MTEQEFQDAVAKLSKEIAGPVIPVLMKTCGHPDRWPKHLREDLYKRLGIVGVENVYTVSE